MNKTGFIKELSKVTGLDEKDCTVINSVIEDTFLIGIKNKDKMVLGFKEKLDLSDEKAEEIYEKAMDLITTHMKDKIKHPFRKDN